MGVVVAVVGGALLVWLALVVTLALAGRAHSGKPGLRDALRMVPDVVRLVRRLVADPSVPRRVKVVLVVLLGYLLSPIDLVPDFIPVLGYADDAIIVALVIRYVVRHAGTTALEKHWAGTPAGLSALQSFAGVPA